MAPVAQFEFASNPRGVGFRDVILSVLGYLPAVVKLDPSRVKLVADRKIDPRALGETHLRVRPLRRTSQDDPGGGRNATWKTRLFAVDCVVRLALDDASSDLAALTDPDEGLLALEDRVLEALDGHTPARLEADGVTQTPLTLEPLRETHTDDPNRPLPADGFCASTVYFESRYIPSYTTART